MYFGSEVHNPCRLTLRLLLNCLSFWSVVLLLKFPNFTSWMRLTLPWQILFLWLLFDPWSRHPFCLFQLNLFQGAPPLETPDLNHQLFPWIEFGLELLAASLLGLLLFVHGVWLHPHLRQHGRTRDGSRDSGLFRRFHTIPWGILWHRRGLSS